MKDRTIYLVRHGMLQIQDDLKRFIGQEDVPLNEEGVKQANSLRQRLEYEIIEAIYCSDLSRSLQTAGIIAGKRNIPVIPRKDLREISLGEWEGKSFDEIIGWSPDEFRARGEDIVNYCIPGGESFAECSDRVISAFHDILTSSSGNVLISGHAGVNRLILCHVSGIPLNNLLTIKQDYGCLIVCPACACQSKSN